MKFFLVLIIFLSACCRGSIEEGSLLVLASTIGPVDAGIVSALEDGFEKETGFIVRHIGAGTGETLKIAQKGGIDIVLVHAKILEEKFIADGFGTERIPLMYNDFVIAGPADDTAGIKGKKSAAEALALIASKQAQFITRGDNSGTHAAEKVLWEKAKVKPEGRWYKVFEQGSTGNAPTLQFADLQNAYIVIDRATVLTLKGKIKLQILVEKDEALLNYMSLIPVNPSKIKNADYALAMKFAEWCCDPDKGQKIIASFGKEKYGVPLFTPDSKEWNKKNKGDINEKI